MAYIRKRGDKWRAEVERNGQRLSMSFPTKAHASAWAAEQESVIFDGKLGKLPNKTMAQALKRYAEDVSPKKKGSREEGVRLKKMQADLPFKNKIIREVTTDDIAKWRDERLQTVAPNTLTREWTLLRGVFTIAKAEWGWVREIPMDGVKKPRGGKPRIRRVADKEILGLCKELGYEESKPVETLRQKIAVAFLFAIETAMRAGEVRALHPHHVDGRIAHLHETKNGWSREVPLSKRAVELLSKIKLAENEPFFNFSAVTLNNCFHYARKEVAKTLPEIATLHFHDSRREACTRLSKKLGVMELARMIGHRDLKSLMIYYAPSTDELAAKLDDA